MIMAKHAGLSAEQEQVKKNSLEKLCWTQLPVHQRMNANGNRHQMIYFPEAIIQWGTVLVMVILYNCCTIHNNTHSVHNRLLKLWRVRLLSRWPCCYVPSPPLSGGNYRPLPVSGGPGPPIPNMASFSSGSTHTPSPLSATETGNKLQGFKEEADTTGMLRMILD